MRVDHAQQWQHQQESAKACDLCGELRLCVLGEHNLEGEESRGKERVKKRESIERYRQRNREKDALEQSQEGYLQTGNTYMRLILQILNLCGILKAAGFGSKEHNGLEAGELSGIHQHRLVLAEDLVQCAHIGSQLRSRNMFTLGTVFSCLDSPPPWSHNSLPHWHYSPDYYSAQQQRRAHSLWDLGECTIVWHSVETTPTRTPPAV